MWYSVRQRVNIDITPHVRPRRARSSRGSGSRSTYPTDELVSVPSAIPATETTTNKFYCVSCVLNFETRRELETHLETSMAHKLWCEECGAGCDNQSDMDQHTQFFHDVDLEAAEQQYQSEETSDSSQADEQPSLQRNPSVRVRIHSESIVPIAPAVQQPRIEPPRGQLPKLTNPPHNPWLNSSQSTSPSKQIPWPINQPPCNLLLTMSLARLPIPLHPLDSSTARDATRTSGTRVGLPSTSHQRTTISAAVTATPNSPTVAP